MGQLDEVQPGDVVRLKSGGRMMTAGSEDGGIFRCYWFELGDLRQADIPRAALEQAACAG
jgi:uncharacterized protein YodC (DUF2158 family)